MTDIKPVVDEIEALREKATPGPWYHVQAFQAVPAERTVHGPVSAQRVDFVSTNPAPLHRRIVIPMERCEASVRSHDMALIAALVTHWPTIKEKLESLAADKERLTRDRDELHAKLNTPQLHDFAAAVICEAAHQRERWGVDHDEGKAASDWFWLLGYLGGKALQADKAGDRDKLLHHIITTGAACANWHANVSGESTAMRPGIAEPKV